MEPVVLAIGGFDPSGGAGVTADVRTAALCGCVGTAALTALTIQGPRGIVSIRPLRPGDVARQVELIARDMPPRAAKTGMLATGSIVAAVVGAIRRGDIPAPVVDPLLVSSTGVPLLDKDGRRRLARDLIPLAAVVTANLYEASALAGVRVSGVEEMVRAAEALRSMGAGAVVVKGGHLSGNPTDVVLLGGGEPFVLRAGRIGGGSFHGLGCAFSTALACGLARGLGTIQAARKAKRLVRSLIRSAWKPSRGMRLPGFARAMRSGAFASVALAAVCPLVSCAGGFEGRVEKLFDAREKGVERVLQVAPRALEDSSMEVRSIAVWMLGETGRSEIVPQLLDALSDKAPSVRAAALAALARFPDAALVARVAPLARDFDATVRVKALSLLARCDLRGCVEIFRDAAADTDADVRMQAIAALAEARDATALPEITDMLLDDADWRNRAGAARALALLDSDGSGAVAPQARTLLDLAKADSNPMVRSEAQASGALLEKNSAARAREEAEIEMRRRAEATTAARESAAAAKSAQKRPAVHRPSEPNTEGDSTQGVTPEQPRTKQPAGDNPLPAAGEGGTGGTSAR